MRDLHTNLNTWMELLKLVEVKLIQTQRYGDVQF